MSATPTEASRKEYEAKFAELHQDAQVKSKIYEDLFNGLKQQSIKFMSDIRDTWNNIDANLIAFS